ncbi:S9 family peptidase [Adhaeribacter arboris]|uniref:prolyl oligopeptidase n=1 Tax=Adhaeribacter arboris TaxID=2072846 RepID=A0A2T2YH15_9BACT|nr:prolyl oligopeptidase family serine peptidase [Adhaeribacter arboris]PSR54799.1 S9 family peptidase [Adhaeribacter arboris]
MNKITLMVIASGLSLLIACKSSENNNQNIKTEMVTETPVQEIGEPMRKLSFPHTVSAKVNQVDMYHGTTVADPYRWLENDTAKVVKEWVEAQNELTFGYLAKIPFRQKIKQRLTKIWNYPRFEAPFKEGGKYYFFKNNGLQNQKVLYVQEGLKGIPTVFLDPNKFSEDGTTAISAISFSANGDYMAYGTSGGGSDWNTFYVMETATRKKLDDSLQWIKFSDAAWFKDGFFYSRYDEPKTGSKMANKNENQKVYYHKVGTPQAEDLLIYEDKGHSNRTFFAQTTEDERFLIMSVSEGASSFNSLFYKDLTKEKAQIEPLVNNFEAEYVLVENLGDKLLVRTNKNAPHYQLVLIDPEKPQPDNWKIVIPESEDVMDEVSLVNNKLLVTYMRNASSHLLVYDTKGKLLSQVKLPTLGTVTGFRGKKTDKDIFYTFNSFTYPSTIYRYTVATNKSELYRKPQVAVQMDNYETKQIFYTSKDGTKIPMFIVHKKGLILDGKNPTYLYAYGGFNVSILPAFSISRMLWLENNGVLAIPNIRGGGEFGEDWHKAGMTPNKQNVFDDFIAAAEYLINEKYTSPSRLAIAGGSNGGLLVGAVSNQRPELFKVAIPAVGVMDMLRFHKFTIGWAWVEEYGSSDNPEQFKNLLAISPLHNIKEGVSYPATLVTTADHDDRVVPAHSFKYMATLQEKGAGPNPYLIRVDVNAGHGAGKATSLLINEAADTWSFIYYNMGINPYSGKKV